MTEKRKHQALSAEMVRTVTSPGMYADGNGLNLKVEPSGAKRWVQRVTIGGKRSNFGLGGYPAVSLAEARELAGANQRAIRQGRDPLDKKRQSAGEWRRPAMPTFAQAAEQVIEMRRPDVEQLQARCPMEEYSGHICLSRDRFQAFGRDQKQRCAHGPHPHMDQQARDCQAGPATTGNRL